LRRGDLSYVVIPARENRQGSFERAVVNHSRPLFPIR